MPILKGLKLEDIIYQKTIKHYNVIINGKNFYDQEFDSNTKRYEEIRKLTRDGFRTAATSKMEHFVIIVNGWKPSTIITKSSILNVATVLDLPLLTTGEGDDYTTGCLLDYDYIKNITN